MGIPCSAGAGHAITEGCEDAPFPLAGRSTPPSPCGNPTFSTADPPPSSNDHKTTATTTKKKTAWERQEPRRQNPETRQGCGTPQIPREVAGAKNETPSPPQKNGGETTRRAAGGAGEGQKELLVPAVTQQPGCGEGTAATISRSWTLLPATSSAPGRPHTAGPAAPGSVRPCPPHPEAATGHGHSPMPDRPGRSGERSSRHRDAPR